MRSGWTRLLFWSALALLTAGSGVRAQGERALLIRGATVFTVSGATIPGGEVLVRNGRIAAVGKNLAADGAEIVEAAGQYLTPGIIDCHAHIAIQGGVNESSLSVTAMVGTEDVINPEDVNIFRDLAGGVTTSNILHGSANAIGGKNQVIKLRWGQDAEGLKFRHAPPGIKFALGENPKRNGASGGGRYPGTRLGVADVIRDAFRRARAYQQSWAEYERKRQSGIPAIAPRRSLELEPLVEVLQGKRKVHCHCYRSDEILMMLRVAEEFGFRIATFQHVLEGYKVAKEIAAHGAGASTFSDWWAYKIEAYDAIPHNAALMTRKGVLVSVNSDSAEEARHLNQEAAKCMKYGGLTENEALRLVTLNPARQLGIEAWVGSIDVGKDADLVLYNQHPLSPRAVPQRVWIDGKLTFDRARELERVQDLDALKKKLRAAEGGTDPAPTSSAASTSAPGFGPLTIPGATPNLPAGELTAIVNGRVYPVSGPILEKATVLIRGGKIAEVGPDVRVPAGAKIVDAAGLRVYPGMIDGITNIGLLEIRSITETDDTEELGEHNPQLRAYDAIHPASEVIPVTRVSGVTTVLSLPEGGMISGQAALLNLAGWTVEEMALLPSAGVVCQLGAGGGGSDFGGGIAPSAEARRQAQLRLKRLEELFEQARHYQQAKEAAGKNPDARSFTPDARLEALIPVIQGKVPLLWRAHWKSRILEAVEFAAKQKVRLVILGGGEAGKVAAKLKEHDVAVVYGPLLRLPGREDDPYDLPLTAPAQLAKAGVRFAISAGDTYKTRNLPFEAGNAAGNGLTEEQALRAVTLGPAEILGVADRLGSLEKGKLANVVIADGDLLEMRTHVRHVFINGRPISLESKHTRLWDQYRVR